MGLGSNVSLSVDGIDRQLGLTPTKIDGTGVGGSVKLGQVWVVGCVRGYRKDRQMDH